MIICTFMLIQTLGGKQRPFNKKIIYYSNMSGKRSTILEKSGKNQGISSGRKSGNPDDGFGLKFWEFFPREMRLNLPHVRLTHGKIELNTRKL